MFSRNDRYFYECITRRTEAWQWQTGIPVSLVRSFSVTLAGQFIATMFSGSLVLALVAIKAVDDEDGTGWTVAEERHTRLTVHVTQRYKLIRLKRERLAGRLTRTNQLGAAIVDRKILGTRPSLAQEAREQANENKKDVRLPRRRKLRIKLGSRQLMSLRRETDRWTDRTNRLTKGIREKRRDEIVMERSLCMCVGYIELNRVRSLVRLLTTSLKNCDSVIACFFTPPTSSSRYSLSRLSTDFPWTEFAKGKWKIGFKAW